MSDATTIATSRRPAEALRLHMEMLELHATGAADAASVALFESLFYRLSPYADDRLPLIAAAAYARLGRQDAAFLLAGLAVQMQPAAPETLPAWRMLHAEFHRTGRAVEADAVAADMAARFPAALLPETTLRPPPDEDCAALALEAAQIAADPAPQSRLLAALERLERTRDWPGSAQVFEAVWHRLPLVEEFWIFSRMAHVYADLHRDDAAFLLAGLAVQNDPSSMSARAPYARLFELFRKSRRWQAAAELARRHDFFWPAHPLVAAAELAPVLQAAGPLPPAKAAPLRRDHPIYPESKRPPQHWRRYGAGMPAGLIEVSQEMTRLPVGIVELRDVEVLVCDDHFAVFDADGMACPDVSVGHAPAVLRRRFAALHRAGQAPARATINAAVLSGDEFPAPNICHFLLDHATRLLLYRDAGIDLRRVTVIGPELRAEYQHDMAARLGIAAWHGTAAPARLRVRRLFVSSNCRHLRHPAHWGAAWAIDAVRGLFDLAPRGPARRLLISRADSDYRRIANEPALRALLEPLGFETIVPGRLSFAAQIAAFREATHVVGPHGAGLTNILFCAPGTRVMEVFHPLYGTWAYAMLSAAIGLDYASLVGRDALSDAAEFNDPALPQMRRNLLAGRDMQVDLDDMRRWLADTGTA